MATEIKLELYWTYTQTGLKQSPTMLPEGKRKVGSQKDTQIRTIN